MLAEFVLLLKEGGKIIDKYVKNKNEAKKMKAELKIATKKSNDLRVKAQADVNRQQSETNTQEAKSKSTFVAGWRPFIGWTCGIGIAWGYIGDPFAQNIMLLAGYHQPNWVSINTESLYALVITMLGVSGSRTFEKLKGIATERLSR